MLRQLEELHLSYEQVKRNTAEVVHLSGRLTLSSWSVNTHTGSTVPTASQLSLTEASGLASHRPMSPRSHQVAFASPRGQLSAQGSGCASGSCSFWQLSPGPPELLPHCSFHPNCQEKDVEFPALRFSGQAGLFNCVTGGTTHVTVREACLCHQRQLLLGKRCPGTAWKGTCRGLTWLCGAEVAWPGRGRVFREHSTWAQGQQHSGRSRSMTPA